MVVWVKSSGGMGSLYRSQHELCFIFKKGKESHTNNVELGKNGRIEIRGFGSFVVRKYDAYTGRNPKTGKSIKVSPKKLPFFKVGKELKERVDGKR